MFAQTRFSIGINVGGYGRPYAPVSSYAYNRPPCPGPGYTWVDGYWSQDYGRNVWVAGYWQRPAYQYQYAPQYQYPRARDWDRDGDRGFRDRDRDGDRGFRNRDRDYRDGDRGYGYRGR